MFHLSHPHHQVAVPRAVLLVGEPACFVHSFAAVLSSLPLTNDLGMTTQMISLEEPILSLADHGNNESSEMPRVNEENCKHVYRSTQHQVYVRRCSLGNLTEY